MTTANLIITGTKHQLQQLKRNQFVVLPIAQYDALLQRLEELQDVLDSERAMKDYRAGKGRSFDDYAKKRETKNHVSRRARK